MSAGNVRPWGNYAVTDRRRGLMPLLDEIVAALRSFRTYKQPEGWWALSWQYDAEDGSYPWRAETKGLRRDFRFLSDAICWLDGMWYGEDTHGDTFFSDLLRSYAKTMGVRMGGGRFEDSEEYLALPPEVL